MMNKNLLKAIDILCTKDDDTLNLDVKKSQNKKGVLFFNDLNLNSQTMTTNRHIMIGGDLSRYFQIGFNESKEICFIGISQFFLDVMGFIDVEIAWANKEQKRNVVYVNFALKKQRIGDFSLSNQKFALPVYNENIKKAVMDATMLVVIATRFDGMFSHADLYSPVVEFNNIYDKKDKKNSQTSTFKKTNF